MQKQYYDLKRRSEIQEGVKKLRKKFLRYREAEIIYSISHRRLLELAGEAGAIVRIDNAVLIDRDIFNEYLDRFREPSSLNRDNQPASKTGEEKTGSKGKLS